MENSVSNENISKISLRMVLVAYMFVSALTQMFWLNFASIDTYMEKLLNLSAMKVGFLTLVFPVTFLILSVPAGIIIDRKGYKFGTGLGAILIAVFSVFRLFAPYSYVVLLISQIGISLGQPFVLNSITKLSMDYFPEDEQATIVGLGSLSLFIGMIAGLSLTPFLISKIGYIGMLIIYALLSIAGAFLFFAFTPSLRNFHKSYETILSYFDEMLFIAKSREMILLGIIAFIGIGVFNGIATWLEKILSVMHGIPMSKAGNISGILILGGIAGCIVMPELSDRFKRRKPFLVAGLFAAFLLLLVFALIPGGAIPDSIVLALLGFFAISTFPIMLSMSAEISGENLAGFAASFLQLLGNGAAALIVPGVDMFYKASHTYKLPLIYLASLFIIAIFSSVMIKENYSFKE